MLMDQNLHLSAAQPITATAVSTYTYDILKGLSIPSNGGTYAVPSGDIIGNASFFGEDLGAGNGLGEPVFVFGTGSGTPSGATSLEIRIQCAPDNGGGTIAGLAFTTYVSSGAIPLASILGASRIWQTAWPRRVPPGVPLPRFLNINYVVTGANFAGLAINADVTLGGEDAVNTVPRYPANF